MIKSFVVAGLALLILSTSVKARAYLTPHQYYDPARHFLINVGKTHWGLFGPDDPTSETSLEDHKLQFIARSPEIIGGAIQPTLTMRVDPGRWRSARAYAERWLRDFPKFGFDLQMARETTFGNLKGYDMELLSQSDHRRARQFVVQRPDEVWVFTCSADDAHFRKAWLACEKILRTASAH